MGKQNSSIHQAIYRAYRAIYRFCDKEDEKSNMISIYPRRFLRETSQ